MTCYLLLFQMFGGGDLVNTCGPSSLETLTLKLACKPYSSNPEQWQQYSDETIKSKAKELKTFLANNISSYNYDEMGFRGRGIVILAAGYNFHLASIVYTFLRDYKCTLPVEVWQVGDELSPLQKKFLSDKGMIVKDMLVEQKKRSAFAHIPIVTRSLQNHDSRKYHLKSMAILLSDFQEILYLDSDNYPVANPEYLFNTEAYKSNGAVFWADFWKFPPSHIIWKITETSYVDEWEQESGQMLLDKKRAWKGLLTALFFQFDSFYFEIVHGDKDTFRFAFKVTNTPYYMNHFPSGIAGYVDPNGADRRLAGHTMLQSDLEGNPLFFHATLMKFRSINDPLFWNTILYLKAKKISKDLISCRNFGSEEIYNVVVDAPCYRWSLKPYVLEGELVRQTVTVRKSKLERHGVYAVDNFEMIQVSLEDYQHGRLVSFERRFRELLGKDPLNFRCGGGHVQSGTCYLQDECCSRDVSFCTIYFRDGVDHQ
jgi:hypothetical protein